MKTIQNIEGAKLERIVFDILTKTYGDFFQLNYQIRKPRYQIDIIKYNTESKLLRKLPWIFYPTKFYEIKKTENLISQKEVADIYAKSRVLKIAPKKFTVITNGRFSDNIYSFIRTFHRKERINLVNGTGLAKMLAKVNPKIKYNKILNNGYLPLSTIEQYHGS